eukprot:1395430-Amorphochlora_amoeboformis.AAC.1
MAFGLGLRSDHYGLRGRVTIRPFWSSGKGYDQTILVFGLGFGSDYSPRNHWRCIEWFKFRLGYPV